MVTIDSGAKLDIKSLRSLAEGERVNIITASVGFADTTLFNLDPQWNNILEQGIDGNVYYLKALTKIGSWLPQGASLLAVNQEAAARMQRQFYRHFQDRHWEYWHDWSNGNDPLILGSAPCDTLKSRGQSPRTWASFTGDWLGRDAIGDISGYDLNSAGVIVGMDRKVTRNLFVGAAFGYDNAYQELRTEKAADRIDAFRSVLYSGLRRGNVFTDAYLGYTKDWHQTWRESGGGSARSKYNDDLFSMGFDVRRKMSLGNMRFVPSAGLHYLYLDSPSVEETGTNALQMASRHYESLRMPLGFKMSRSFSGSHGITLTPETRVFYVREFADDMATARGTNFLVDSGSWGRDSGRFGLGLNVQLTNRMNFRIDYDYEVYSRTTADQLSATLGVNW
jgi:outer membrane autotransporter protein